MQSFADNYVKFDNQDLIRVLDVGSRIVIPNALTYRTFFSDKNVEYVGLDVEPGLNVDYVPKDPYSWDEIGDDSFDVIVSGQAFEHAPYFWITSAEMSRVLKPGGLLCLIFPSSGAVHRYPFDCWRFYPDSAQAITQFAGLELIEADTEQSGFRKRVRTNWKDTFVIARKTTAHDEATSKRLRSIVAGRPSTEFVDLKIKRGPAITQYENAVKISFVVYGLASMKRFIFSLWRHRLLLVKKLIRYDQRKQ